MAPFGVLLFGVLPSFAQGISEECQHYLDSKGFLSIYDLQWHMKNYHEGSHSYNMPCREDGSMQYKYMPDPSPQIPGATDTSGLSCRYGNIGMFNEHESTCCGVKPHFNWIVSTCEDTQAPGQFCKNLPGCAVKDGVQINYVASYQYDGSNWVMMDDSTAGEISSAGVYGNYAEATTMTASNLTSSTALGCRGGLLDRATNMNGWYGGRVAAESDCTYRCHSTDFGKNLGCSCSVFSRDGGGTCELYAAEPQGCQGALLNTASNMNGWYGGRDATEDDCTYRCHSTIFGKNLGCGCSEFSTDGSGTCKLYGSGSEPGGFTKGRGWEHVKESFRWPGGDWTTKYAPWAKGDGASGPRGATPPGALWILSAENFYYGAFYMLTQLTLNLEGRGNPTGTNCWVWELDPVEGAIGWNPNGPTPGNVNQLYSTSSAQTSGCMPLAHTAAQSQGGRQSFQQPEIFRDHCNSGNSQDAGCSPWNSGNQVEWSGGATSTHRFENLWGQPYVFAVVIDAIGYWTYRWQPSSDGSTGWPGVKRHSADRVLTAKPNRVNNEAGLRTDVRGDVTEAVILQPALQPAFSCLRSSIESVNWEWGAGALGSIAQEMGQSGPGQAFEGAQNWWANFANTGQYQNYPISIMGVPRSEMSQGSCHDPNSWSCQCKLWQEGDASNASQAFHV